MKYFQFIPGKYVEWFSSVFSELWALWILYWKIETTLYPFGKNIFSCPSYTIYDHFKSICSILHHLLGLPSFNDSVKVHLRQNKSGEKKRFCVCMYVCMCVPSGLYPWLAFIWMPMTLPIGRERVHPPSYLSNEAEICTLANQPTLRLFLFCARLLFTLPI